MSDYQDHQWFVNLVAKLLEGDRAVLALLRSSPFRQRPPQYVRAQLYEYHFTTPAERRESGVVEAQPESRILPRCISP
jgi:hypothetical protein